MPLRNVLFLKYKSGFMSIFFAFWLLVMAVAVVLACVAIGRVLVIALRRCCCIWFSSEMENDKIMCGLGCCKVVFQPPLVSISH